MLPIFLVVFIVLHQGETQDVCDQYEPLPNAGLRYYNYQVNRVIVHDFNLIPGWYRAGNEIMPTDKPTSLYICGTQFPIWMNGTHPTVAEGVVNRVACAVGAESFCSTSYPIQVKNCTDYSVYYLINTKTSNEAYCFGIGQDGEEPTFVPLKPVVYAIEVEKQGATTIFTHVHFVCDFEPSQNESEADLHYQVFWYTVKNNIETEYIMLEQPKDKMSDLQLTEDIFINKMKQTLGVEISCAVLALSGPKGVPGIRSDRSDALFAGIRVNVVKSMIVRGDDKEQGLVTLTSTIPIGCVGKTGCSLPVRANVPDEYKCKGPSFGNNCGTSIASSKWNNSHNIVIKAADTAEYSLQGIFFVHLKTARFWTSARIWDDYYLPNFQVQIVDSTNKDWRGKICSSNNDPHMRTFDGRSFENHSPGEYILYRHLFYKAEVQMKIRSCGWGHVQCNCGVAVKAGLDVFVVDLCENIPFVGYKDGLCVESALDVRKSGNTYTIFLLYGTYITFSLSPGHKFFNIAITSSVHDQSANSTGLCGALTGDDCTDDFRMRDGSWPMTGINLPCNSNPLIQPHASFLNEWSVRPNENLFVLSQDVKDNLSPWVTYVCVCGNASVDTADAPIPCGGHTTQECHSGPKVGTRACKIINTRLRRSIPTNDRFPAPTDRKRRSTTNRQEERIHMTEVEALTYCQNYMNTSQIYSLCQNVPSTRPEKNVETCALDIILTNTTIWSETSRESMREQCLNEISRNNTFREVEEASGIVAEIQEKACPSMCSNRGHCVNGTCICDPGYGASDCSTNLHEPPDIFGLLDNGLCDERHVECDHAFVYGEIFVEGKNLTCRIKSFTMSYQGDKTFDRTDYVSAEHETLFEVVCPVQKTRRKKRSLQKNIQTSDRFVIGYTISVSNDGLNYGKDFDLYMYNSECQLPENTSTTITFGLQDGYCFIDHTCIIRGTIYEKDECLICNDTQSEFQWSTRENHTGCRNVPETSPTTISPKGSSTNLKINFALLFASTLALIIIFQS